MSSLHFKLRVAQTQTVYGHARLEEKLNKFQLYTYWSRAVNSHKQAHSHTRSLRDVGGWAISSLQLLLNSVEAHSECRL